jgi:hypothetical protein
MKITQYREKYASPKLKKLLDDCNSAIILYATYQDYRRVAHEESRINRNINADTVIKDLNLFVKKYKKMIKETDDMMEMSALLIGLREIEKELTKKKNKRSGGFKADKTKKEPVTKEKATEWIELDYSPFSVNFMYEYKYNKKVRSQAYSSWKTNFPVDEVPSMIEIWNKYGIDVREKIALDIEVITVSSMDVDNCIKSLQDTLFQDCWRLPDDNNVTAINIKRIGIADNYNNCLIRFRIREVM